MKITAFETKHNEVNPIFVTGAFSLSSADFLVPLIAQQPSFRVLVLPPLEFSTTQAFLDRSEECLQRGYLALRTPLGFERLSIFRSHPDDSVEAVRTWYLRGLAELKQAGLIVPEQTWRENGGKLIDLYNHELRKHMVPLQPTDITVSWLRTLYEMAGCVVAVQAHNGIIRLPLVRQSAPEDYLFIRELINLSQISGLMNLSGRGSLLYRYDPSMPWIQVRKFKRIEDEQVVVETAKPIGTQIRLRISSNEIQLTDAFEHQAVEFRPLGALRLMHLAAFGIPAHIPWYNKSPKPRRTVVWQSTAKVFVTPHAPLSTTALRFPRQASGSYLWDCCPSTSVSHRNLMAIANKFLGQTDDNEHLFLTDFAQGLQGKRARKSPYTHARGYLQTNWRMLIEWAKARQVRAIPKSAWCLLDCLMFALSIWIVLRSMRKQLQLEGKILFDDLSTLLGTNPTTTVQEFIERASNCGHTFGYPEVLTQFSLSKISKPEELERVSLTRLTRGWFEIASGLTVTIWNYCNSVLSSDVTLITILGQSIDSSNRQPYMAARDGSIIITRR